MKLVLSLILTTTIGLCISSRAEKQQKVSEKVESEIVKAEDVVKHGAYLVTKMGCNDFHSLKKMGPNGPEIISELSGYPSDKLIVKVDSPLIKEDFSTFHPDLTAAAGPWGISFTGNLTPDEYGIGTW